MMSQLNPPDSDSKANELAERIEAETEKLRPDSLCQADRQKITAIMSLFADARNKKDVDEMRTWVDKMEAYLSQEISKAVVANIKRELRDIVDPGDGTVYTTTRIGVNALKRFKDLESPSNKGGL